MNFPAPVQAVIRIVRMLWSAFGFFDLDTMRHVVVSVLPGQEPAENLSLEAIRAIAKQDVVDLRRQWNDRP